MFCLECGTRIPEKSSRCTACGWEMAATTPMAAAMPQPGDERDEVARALADEYEISEELGRGGMAIVYRAVERALDREVAIKVLPFTFAFDNDFVERFQREARTAARLEHPHIIPIYRVGRTGNVIYFTMKFLRGDSLARVIAYRGALKPHEIRRLLREAGGALGYAHKHRVVHRDVKPDNIMYHESGHAVVCDFGIAKAASESKLTGTGTAIGTPHYMSPEQARAQPLDGRSDLYSLGVVAYKCLTGRVPFDAEDSYAIGIKHITEPLPQSEFETADQRDLFGVIERLLEKNPDDRFANAGEMIDAIETLDVTHGKGAGAVVVETRPSMSDHVATEVASAAPTHETPTTPMPRSAGSEPRAAGRRKVPALVGTLVLMVGVGGGIYAWTRPGPEDVVGGAPPGAAAPVQVASENTDPEPPVIEPQVTAGTGGTSVTPTAPAPQNLARSTPSNQARPADTVQTPAGGGVSSPPTPQSGEAAPVLDSLASEAPTSLGGTPPPRDTVAQTPPPPDRASLPDSAAPADSAPPRAARPAPGVGTLADSLRNRAIAAGMGRLEIRGMGNGSRVFIGDREVRGRSHNLQAGRHTVRVVRPGFEDFVQAIDVEAGKVFRLRVRQRRSGRDAGLS